MKSYIGVIITLSLVTVFAYAGAIDLRSPSTGGSGGSGGSYTDTDARAATGWTSDGGSTVTTQRAGVGGAGLSTDGGIMFHGSIIGLRRSDLATMLTFNGETSAITAASGFSCNSSAQCIASVFTIGSGTYRTGAVNGPILISATAPTIASGFGTSPSISAVSGTFAFRITIGTGGTDSAGVLTLPTASNAWSCFFTDQTTPGPNITKQTASTTTSITVTNYAATTGLAAAWTAGDIIIAHCGGQ